MQRPLVILLAALAIPAALPAQADSTTGPDPIAQLVARLDLKRYKATIKGLTRFGDRRQGTDRNRAAVDWIEAQLRSYGCGSVARLKYEYQPPSSPSPEGREGQGVRPRAMTALAPRSSWSWHASSRAPTCAPIARSASSSGTTRRPASTAHARTSSNVARSRARPRSRNGSAISLRENERGTQIGAGWDPNWHQPTDLYATYSDKDFRLGLNAAQTTLAALAGLVGATIK